ncbi:ATPase [Thermoproteus uzoniensis 768-20]|uniref:ATPase n=1 Tax=Thermoproteus uzoniensis (strain 768-20) TaxID=999630 RepID=F2L610_THEU7|nr:ATP-binding protein [Thermoproteus uzoniensis]AEA12455.1 ATPase [Thermoproteus uzoniensis 768-20]
MYFDPRPKRSREDLYDREAEIEALKAMRAPMSLVLGLRRAGKSSVILVALSELGHPSVYVDAREFEGELYIAYKDLARALGDALSAPLRRFPKLAEALRTVRGISVAGLRVELEWGRERAGLADVLKALDRWAEREGEKVVVALDEAQELSKLRGYDVLPALAYAYDNLKNIYFILSGSAAGLMDRFLKLQDPRSPLYGRYLERVELKPFSKEKAADFLARGCEQYGVDPPDVDAVYGTLGGSPGWLTYFGHLYVQLKDVEEALRRTVSYAVGLIRQEFENFLRGREAAERRYRAVMEMAAGCAAWSEVKRGLEAREGRTINDAEVTKLLRNLVDYSFLERRGDLYCPADPLIARAFRPR